ncbi:MAG: WecB/TagA/CpsF family glycosyltransferase [Acidobacteriota bacterium]
MKNSRSSAAQSVTIDRADSVPIIDLDVNVVDLDRVIVSIAKLCSDGGAYVCLANVHMVMEAHDSPDFRRTVNSAALVVPDGMPLVWMQKLQGRPDATRVRGNDLMVGVLSWAAENGIALGFFGGRSSVIDRIRQRALRDFPRIRLDYTYSPPFRPLTDTEDEEVIRAIKAADIDVLFVGLGCPKQEIWMEQHRNSLGCVMIGVGAAFDFYAGSIRESPQWLGRLGLEWLYRLTLEPRRLWRRYITLNPRFIFSALKQLASKSSRIKL